MPKALVDRVTVSDSGCQLRCVDDSFVQDPVARHAHLSFRRESWPAGLAVGIEADAANAGKVFLGVMADSGAIDARLRSMLTSFHAGGAGNEYYPWWYWLAAPYGHWSSKDALLAFRSGEAVEALAAQLADVIAIVDEFSAG